MTELLSVEGQIRLGGGKSKDGVNWIAMWSERC